jgi:hypothetical protein
MPDAPSPNENTYYTRASSPDADADEGLGQGTVDVLSRGELERGFEAAEQAPGAAGGIGGGAEGAGGENGKLRERGDDKVRSWYLDRLAVEPSDIQHQ